MQRRGMALGIPDSVLMSWCLGALVPVADMRVVRAFLEIAFLKVSTSTAARIPSTTVVFGDMRQHRLTSRLLPTGHV
jgi:hypothetical protein